MMKRFSPAWHLQKDGVFDAWLDEGTCADGESTIRARELFAAWQRFALHRNKNPYSLQTFTQEMIRRGFRWFSAGDGPLFGGIDLKW